MNNAEMPRGIAEKGNTLNLLVVIPDAGTIDCLSESPPILHSALGYYRSSISYPGTQE